MKKKGKNTSVPKKRKPKRATTSRLQGHEVSPMESSVSHPSVDEFYFQPYSINVDFSDPFWIDRV